MRKLISDRLAVYFNTCTLCTVRPVWFTYSAESGLASFKREGETVAVDPCAACAHELSKLSGFEDSELFEEHGENMEAGTRRVRASWRAYALTL